MPDTGQSAGSPPPSMRSRGNPLAATPSSGSAGVDPGAEVQPLSHREAEVQPLSHREAEVQPLSHREAEVLAALFTGDSNQQIADRLQISRRTVEAHLRHVYAKLGVRGRSAAMVWAFAQGRDEQYPWIVPGRESCNPATSSKEEGAPAIQRSSVERKENLL